MIGYMGILLLFIGMKIGIFKTYDDLFLQVVDACRELQVEYEIIDILASDWIDRVQRSTCDGFFCLSNSVSQDKKMILDEQVSEL